MISAGVRKQHAEGPLATRDAHAKAHGCVRAEFRVNDRLAPSLHSPVFREGAVYPAWIRFSNGSGRSDDDSVGDGRGMAIKVIGVPGPKLSREVTTQDFLMINHPTFFVRNVADYVDFTRAVGGGNPLPFFFPSANPLKWRLPEMKIARAIQTKKVDDLLATRYWSMTPYLHGDKAVKFTARPCTVHGGLRADRNSPSFLRENLVKRLERGGACFELGVQVQKDPKSMPVEDPTREWNERQSPFVKVASVVIPAQSFDSEAQRHFCENLSFNPWHAVPEHRPLGGINRARKAVYDTISELRHELNREPFIEPDGREEF